MDADGTLRIRPSLWARVAPLAFAAVWVVLFLTRIAGSLSWPVQVLGVVFAVGTSARMAVMGVDGTPDGRLVVRNQLRTRTFRRADVADAVVDRGSMLGLPLSGWRVWLIGTDGSRHLVQITEAPFRAGFEQRLQRHAEEIRRWLTADDRPAPYLPG